MTRNFTAHEAAAFISGGLGVHPVECRGDGKAFAFDGLHMDRDAFDVELQYFAHENSIPLDFGAFTYGENEMEVLTVQIPYTELETEGEYNE